MAPARRHGEAKAPGRIFFGKQPAQRIKPRPLTVSAALGGMRHVLDRDLRELVHLERAHPLVEAMMAVMRDVMAAHLGIGVQHARLHPLGLDDGRLGRVAV